jgi:tRNA (uracil-5-)-methyltransferase
MSTPPSLPPSPPPKRLKAEINTSVEDAPVRALFVPQRAAPAGPSRQRQTEKGNRKRKQRRHLPEPYSPGDVLSHDITDFLGGEDVQQGDAAWEAPEDLPVQTIVELRVGAFTVSGTSAYASEPATS